MYRFVVRARKKWFIRTWS